MRLQKVSWDFTEPSEKEATHAFHMYPAMMIPQIAQRLIKEFGAKSKTLFDPYCGTGTSLVEANINGISGIGTDLNPLARLIATVKTTPIEQQTLDLYLKDFYDFLFQYRFGFRRKDSIVSPQFSNIDFWFSKNVKYDLAVVNDYVGKIEDESVKNFFKVAMSQTIRDCSWTRKNEFKLYKMDAEKIKSFKPDVFSTMERVLAQNRNGMLDFIRRLKKENLTKVYDFNTVEGIPSKCLKEASIDLVVTSPPYGDSQTTVAYGQFSRLANEWLGIKEAQKVDSSLMGGKRLGDIDKFECRSLNEQISKIFEVDEKRAADVYAFYKDYQNSINNVARIIKKGGHACYVVSNRCVKGFTLKTDLYTKKFFEGAGFRHIDTYERKISGKRMPRKNSPIGVTGQTNSLMNKEFIVVMQKN